MAQSDVSMRRADPSRLTLLLTMGSFLVAASIILPLLNGLAGEAASPREWSPMRVRAPVSG